MSKELKANPLGLQLAESEPEKYLILLKSKVPSNLRRIATDRAIEQYLSHLENREPEEKDFQTLANSIPNALTGSGSDLARMALEEMGGVRWPIFTLEFDNTEYPYPFLTWLQAEVMVAAEAVIRDSSLSPLPEFIDVQRIPYGAVDAWSGRNEHNGTIIVFLNDGFLFFLCEFTKALVSVIPAVEDDNQVKYDLDPDRLSKAIANNSEVYARVLELLVAKRILRDIRRAGEYQVSAYVNPLLRQIAHASMIFSLGHEYGHIMLGHLTERSHTHPVKKELEADVMGAEITYRACNAREIPWPNTHCGVDFFFTCLDLWERIGLSKTRDHPPADQRRWLQRHRVANSINAMLPGKTKEAKLAFERGMYISGVFQQMLETVWDKIESAFQRVVEANELT